jgi:hypothetical protein
VVNPKTVTETSEEPIALISGMAVAPISPGTMRKPPPMPKKAGQPADGKANTEERRQHLQHGFSR